MVYKVLQTGGFLTGLVGMALVFAATVMDNWCVKDRQGDMITSVHSYKGLWRNCEVSNGGFTECRPLYALIGYSGHFQTVRALMIVAIVMSVIAVLISLFSLKCVKLRGAKLSAKAKMTLCAGVMLIVAGLCAISGPSVYANDIMACFMMTTYPNQNQGKIGGMGQYNDDIGKGGAGMGGAGMGGAGMCGMGGMGMGGMGMGGTGMGGMGMGGTGMGGMGMGGLGGMDMHGPRFTFGPAIFIAWVGGALLVLGGILKCVSFKGMQGGNDTQQGYVYKAPGQCRPTDEEAEPQRPKKGQKC